jgi:hypothetical protein
LVAEKSPRLRELAWLAGSDAGGQRAAAVASLIATAKFNGLDPEAYLRRVLERITNHPVRRTAEPLRWNLPCDAEAAATRRSAADHRTQRLAPATRRRHLERLGPAALVVRVREIEAEQGEDGADEALGLAQRQAERSPQRRGGDDG